MYASQSAEMRRLDQQPMPPTEPLAGGSFYVTRNRQPPEQGEEILSVHRMGPTPLAASLAVGDRADASSVNSSSTASLAAATSISSAYLPFNMFQQMDRSGPVVEVSADLRVGLHARPAPSIGAADDTATAAAAFASRSMSASSQVKVEKRAAQIHHIYDAVSTTPSAALFSEV
jgi:hypothetical protein